MMYTGYSDDWYEILEPKTNRKLYVNISTGKSQWKCPEKYHKSNEHQFWELYDFDSQQLYYYNVKSSSCSWIKPNDVPTISLVKYQVLKERKKKIFVDKAVQFDADYDLDWKNTVEKQSATGSQEDNLETSGYSTIHSVLQSQQQQQAIQQLPPFLQSSPPLLPPLPPAHNHTPDGRGRRRGDSISSGSSVGSLDRELRRPTCSNAIDTVTIETSMAPAEVRIHSATLPGNSTTGRGGGYRTPRTNPNYVRHNNHVLQPHKQQMGSRLSQPCMDTSSVFNSTGSIVVSSSDNGEGTDSTTAAAAVVISTADDEENEGDDNDAAAGGELDEMMQGYNSLPSQSMQHQNSTTTTTTSSSSSSSRLPRHSVITAINRSAAAAATNSQLPAASSGIWTRDLFDKTDRQLAGLLSWSQKSITDSILATTPKAYKRKACENFKQIQMYMGDRETKISREKLAYAICKRGVSSSAWANEIFMQICKQVTYNPNSERTYHGWDLMCICLKFFHPESMGMKRSFRFFLSQYGAAGDNNNSNIDIQHTAVQPGQFKLRAILCAQVASKLLEMANKVPNIGGVLDIQEAKRTYSNPTVFHSTLQEVMQIQSNTYPNRRLPWILVALTEEIIRCDGMKTQGIMRIPSEQSKMELLMQSIERAFSPHTPVVTPGSDDSLPGGCDPLLNKLLQDCQLEHDPILLSSILKNWFRHMPVSIVPIEEFSESLYDLSRDFDTLMLRIRSLPMNNYLVLQYLIRFLQMMSEEDNVRHTSMPVENLVTLMAPTLFKLEISSLQPAMQLLQTLISDWNTSEIEGIR